MIVYSITYNVEREIEASWLSYMKEVLVRDMLRTGYFSENKILRLLNEEYMAEGVTYSFQFTTQNLEELQDFRENYEFSIETELEKQFGGKFVFFKTWLEVV